MRVRRVSVPQIPFVPTELLFLADNKLLYVDAAVLRLFRKSHLNLAIQNTSTPEISQLCISGLTEYMTIKNNHFGT